MARKKRSYHKKRSYTEQIITIVVALAIIVGIGFLDKWQNRKDDSLSETPVATIVPEETPTIDETMGPIATSDTVDVNVTYSSDEIQDFFGEGYIILNNNEPDFTEVSDTTYFETSSLDELGRCGEAKAMVGPETLATEERGSIGMIKPSGWHTQRYDDIIADRYLYNRGHLIMFALYGNDTNIRENLITETRYANATTQLSFESEILDYVKDTGAHVEYHVRPDFRDGELVARGVELQALSDDGGLKLHVYVYNVQPGVSIDYETGDSVEDSSVYVDGINTTVD